MTRIDGASNLAALLRAQLAEQVRLKGPRRVGVTAQALSDQDNNKAEKFEGSGLSLSLQARLLQRLQAIDGSDPDRRRKAFRAFMEMNLLGEFGDAMQSDPQFEHLLDQVIEQMQTDQQIAAAALEAADMLLAQLDKSASR